MVYVGTYSLIYLHTQLGGRIVSRDELPRGWSTDRVPRSDGDSIMESRVASCRPEFLKMEKSCSVLFNG